MAPAAAATNRGLKMQHEEVLKSAIEGINRRLDDIWDDQRRVIEKLNRLRLVVDAMREERADGQAARGVDIAEP